MKLIVTGSTGNLGKHILKSMNHQCLGISRSNWNKLEEINIGEYDGIIHCAYDLKNNINQCPVKNLDSNILSTARILEIARDKKIKKFIFISSCAVYGDSSNSSEDKHCYPVTMNGHIKLFNEELVKSFCKQHEINYLILRVFNTYGGDDEFSVVQRIINCAKNKTSFTLVNDGISERDFIHVEDVAVIISKLIQHGLQNEIINIGTGTTTKIMDLFLTLEATYGKINFLKKSNPKESVYSRANIEKLKHIISHYEFKVFLKSIIKDQESE